MNRLEEIQELIKKFIYEKQQMRQEINAIEEKRNVLAQERNNKINENNGKAYTEEVQARIFELGNQIKELGNQSQELQNKLDKKYLNIKNEVANEINSNIASIMPGVKEKEEKRAEIQQHIEEKENRDTRYIKQKEEFYKRFGRIPVLSENAMKENELQEEEYRKNKLLIEQLNNEIKVQEEEISKFVKVANDFKKGNLKEYIENNQEQESATDLYKKEMINSYTQKIVEEVIEPIVESVVDENIVSENKENIEEDSIILPFLNEEKSNIQEIHEEENALENINVEEIKIDEIVPIKEVNVQEIESLEAINIEEIKPIEDVNVEEITVEEVVPLEEIKVEELETLKKADFEEDTNTEQPTEEVDDVNNTIKLEEFVDQDIEQQEEKSLEEILAEEEEKIQQETAQVETQEIQENESETKKIDLNNDINENISNYENKEEDTIRINNYFGEKVNLLNINAKFEDGDIVYKAQTSNGDCIKLYPRKSETGNILLKDKENREELKEILINYAIAEYRMFDKKVIKKIDPSICEILIRFAKKYNYDAQSLIYNYAMSFSKNDESELDNIPTITYNFAYLKETDLDKKEKDVITKICKNAKKNCKIDIIGYNTGIKKIRYIFKRTLSINEANALPEGKY